ncbi:hypothetical protein N7517_009269 [Penicillium concentricum]|uniref:FHA domain-containing protein n=1 Tax=Penicillium concentricum TaxID=293559 RepID=A0A9W9RGX8_9EURO|nr:uncharacterized protein N7517_009269 [Penicillium concentricum]KAJ5360078.1 hypothetical protein N7517_009269 [Penicillium concentricum]
MESSPLKSRVGSILGVKRPAALLPAFEPSSSPSLPRPQKRVAREPDVSTYPTPVPTSSTHIMSSSPPPGVAASRPALSRSFSAALERAPLSAVPAIMLLENGEPILMGRSSVSCHHQLAASRMISRVHVKATYKPAPNPFDRDRVEIVCMGWNGIKIHCQGRKYDLAKGKTFTSDIKDADIMIDVHEARVLVQWPRNERRDCPSTDSEQTSDEATPTQRRQSRRELQESPLLDRQRLASPVSPSPAAQHAIPPSSPIFTPSRSRAAVVVFEDEPSPLKRHNTVTGVMSQSARHATAMLNHTSRASELSDLSRSEEFSDNDEENDPIIHSFGPFGENLLPRMASFRAGDSPVHTARSPRSLLPAQPLQPTRSPRQPATVHEDREFETPEVKPQYTDERSERVRNHAANQLAFSRLSSTPFSTILNNLPPAYWKSGHEYPTGLLRSDIRNILESTKFIGRVAREGKDAAGKPLESEYYYVPDEDDDAMRRSAVVDDLRKPGLRNCRKQHKQYFWRKPK